MASRDKETFFFVAERVVDPTIHQREKHVQSFSEANTLRCGSCLVEGEAEVTAHLSDNRAQSLKMLRSITMTLGMERVEVGGMWVGCGRGPYDLRKDYCDSAPTVPRLRTAPNIINDFPLVVRSASSTETIQKPPRHNLDDDDALLCSEQESAFNDPP